MPRMESLDMFSAITLGVVEGLTELIPVSSTGHMIMVGEFLKFQGEKAEVFEVFILLGTILAVAAVSCDRFRYLLDFRSTLNMSSFRGCRPLFLITAAAVVGALWFFLHPAENTGEKRASPVRADPKADCRIADHSTSAFPAVESESLPEGRGCAYHLHAERVMGSPFNAAIVFAKPDEKRARAALIASLGAVQDLEKLISKYDPASEVRRLSGLPPGEMRRVSPQTFRAVLICRDLWAHSNGAFDCTVGPLVKLYKFTGQEEERMPSADELSAALAKVGTDKLLLDHEKRAVGFKVAGMELDLNAVGQGFGADAACDALRKAGAASAVVELGGEVASFREKWPGHPWQVGIIHPRATERLMHTFGINGNAVSTSGDYEKFFKKDGHRESHILDARTGKPLMGGAVSVTIIAPQCILADGKASAVSILGPIEGMKLIERYRAEGQAVEAIIVEETADGRLVPHLSPGLAGKVKLKLDLEPAHQSPGK